MSIEKNEKEIVSVVGAQTEKTADGVLEVKKFYEDGRNLWRTKRRSGEKITEEWSEEFNENGRMGTRKLPGKLVIEEEFSGPHSEEQRVVSYWKPSSDGKNLIHVARVEEKNGERWDPLPNTETDYDMFKK